MTGTKQAEAEAAVASAILSMEHVTREFRVRGGVLRAVDDVSLTVPPRRTLGIVGESGCGKTTLSRIILRLDRPTSGTVRFEGRDVSKLGRSALRDYHRKVSAVFQDPYSALNPRHRVSHIVMEPVVVNGGVDRAGRPARLDELLRSVGLPTAAANSYPHEFSGGQRQRIAIARAISQSPDLIVLDEPVSALDVSIRAQILNLLKQLQDRLGVAYVFIAHDLAAVRHMSHEVAVMYLGAVVEHGPSEALYASPRHPYTRGLLEASLPPDLENPLATGGIKGEIPSPIDPPSGCRFRTRCPLAEARCAEERPVLREIEPSHVVACHFAERTGGVPVRHS